MFFEIDSVDHSWINYPIHYFFLFSGNWSSFPVPGWYPAKTPCPAALVLYGWCPFSMVNAYPIPLTKCFQYHSYVTTHVVTAIGSQQSLFSNMTMPYRPLVGGPGKGIWPKLCHLDPFQKELGFGSSIVCVTLWTTKEVNSGALKLENQAKPVWADERRKQGGSPTEKSKLQEVNLGSSSHSRPQFQFILEADCISALDFH